MARLSIKRPVTERCWRNTSAAPAPEPRTLPFAHIRQTCEHRIGNSQGRSDGSGEDPSRRPTSIPTVLQAPVGSARARLGPHPVLPPPAPGDGHPHRTERPPSGR
ncbi:hypothetical protein ADK82_18530 [Streptomyces sp. NRRL S-4]|nr:hypothetical protein ADK82_18530 [Streptomyces sp. NRRL S-4]